MANGDSNNEGNDSRTVLLTLYGLLLLIGGSIGFAKKGSVASLAAGGGSGVIVMALAQAGVEKNKLLLQVITGLLFVGMGFRAAKSGAIMPGGMVAILSGLALGSLTVA